MGWEDPNSDPLGDVLTALQDVGKVRVETGSTLYLGPIVYDTMTRILGHEPTVADIPAGVPGNWTAIVRLD